MDLGFAQAGWTIVWANDLDPWAVETYRANVGDHAVCGDVLDLAVPECAPDVVIGGRRARGSR